MRTPTHLRLVGEGRERCEQTRLRGSGDVALTAALLGVNLVPIVGEALRGGRWGAGTVGFATACALLAGRELWLEIRALLRSRR